MRPIFLHGMWRSGSTYVWSRFRASSETYCYFEPLYSGLSKLTPERIFGPRWDDAVSDNRHPQLAEPYFAEYAPLTPRRGVRGYSPRFAFHRYALTPADRWPELAGYISILLEQAEIRDKTAVLGFNRSTLRINWLKQAFRSANVYIERDPTLIWSSYMQHVAEGNYSYFKNLLTIFELNARHPLFAPLAERLPLRRPLDRLAKPKHFYRAVFERMPREISYALVVYTWALSLLHGLTHCDVVVDSALAERPGYAGDIGACVSRVCGLDVQFSDLRQVAGGVELDAGDKDAAERLVLDLLPKSAVAFFDPAAAAARLNQISPTKADFLRELLAVNATRRAA